MRTHEKVDGLHVSAIAGTHVVILGMNMPRKRAAGLLGFAIKREDLTEEESYWMSGIKTFEAVQPFSAPGEQFDTILHPIQSFQWADYSAKPGHAYRYHVIAMFGKPGKLERGQTVVVEVNTEIEGTLTTKHSVYFNRGSTATQEYARRFQDSPPSKAGPAAYQWLSRGLLEALVAFISQAKGAKFGLYGAIYEFQWNMALEAIKAASDSGADVRIIFDNFGPGIKNLKSIQEAGLEPICTGRKKSKIAHNKFLVLTERKGEKVVPLAVWTGSTNWTENGIFGHSNLGHIVRDESVAADFLDYWEQLLIDPDLKDLKKYCSDRTPVPPVATNLITPVFSPRSGLKPLEWYASEAASAREGLFMTFAFGMHSSFLTAYQQDDDVLKFALMETAGMRAEAKTAIDQVRRRPNVVVAVGNRIVTNSFDRWLKTLDKVNPHVHVQWVHTKFLIKDPLGENPVVITGSANFSEASTHTNDENMLVIRDDPRVADIYLGEFMRLHQHYAFREAVRLARERKQEWKPQFLLDNDKWVDPFFKPGSARQLRRDFFARSF